MEVQMQDMKGSYTREKIYAVPEEKELVKTTPQPLQKSPCLWYMLSLLIFLLAAGVYIGIWAADNFFNVNDQASHFYTVPSPISSYLNLPSATISTAIFSDLTSIQPIAVSLVYSWVLWKFALVVFAFKLSEAQPKMVVKVASLVVLLIVMLAVDVLGTIFVFDIYQDYIFFAVSSLLICVVSLVNNQLTRQKPNSTIKNAFLPLLYIGLLVSLFSILLPTAYQQLLNNFSTIKSYLIIAYAYPLIDLALYALLLRINSYLDDHVRGFLSCLGFLLLGYEVGLMLIIGYTEVEFYYLLSYFFFRNIFSNWVMHRWQKVVNNPPALPGWGIVYYASYVLNFLPVMAVGKMVVAKGFYSPMFSFASTMLYGTGNPNYLSSSYMAATYNTSFNGNIYWVAGAIIWLVTTLTQQYQRRKPELSDIFMNLLGLQLFYIAITCGITIPLLAVNGHI